MYIYIYAAKLDKVIDRYHDEKVSEFISVKYLGLSQFFTEYANVHYKSRC